MATAYISAKQPYLTVEELYVTANESYTRTVACSFARHVERGHFWARLVLPPPGAEERGGFEASHYFSFVCINLHKVPNAQLLADVQHGLQFAQAC